MAIREINRDDIPELFRVRIATWHNENGAKELTELGITEQSVEKLLETSHRGWLYENDQQIVGFAIGDQSNGEMWVIAVLKEFEGQGIGKQLLTRVEDWLFSKGWQEIWLTTDPDENYRAVGFYRRNGWQDWKLDPGGDRYMKKNCQKPMITSNADSFCMGNFSWRHMSSLQSTCCER